MNAAAELGRNPVVSKRPIQPEYLYYRDERDGTVQYVSRDKILWRERGLSQGRGKCIYVHITGYGSGEEHTQHTNTHTTIISQYHNIITISGLTDMWTAVLHYRALHGVPDNVGGPMWMRRVIFIFIFYSERAARAGGGGRGALPDFFFFFSPVQQTTSGIGHRVKSFFSGWQPMR